LSKSFLFPGEKDAIVSGREDLSCIRTALPGLERPQKNQ